MSEIEPQILIHVKNDSGLIIPPRSVVVCVGVEMQLGNTQESIALHHVRKYTGQKGNIYVTDGGPIMPDQEGTAYADPLIYVAIDPAAGFPVAGDEWGPKRDTWTITKGRKGFIAQGYAATNSRPDMSIFFRISPSSGGLFLFKLAEVDCEELTAIGHPIRGPVGSLPDGLPPDRQKIVDSIDSNGVWESIGCFLSGGSPVLLNGQYAWCQEIDPDPYAPTVRLWAIINMCGLGPNCAP